MTPHQKSGSDDQAMKRDFHDEPERILSSKQVSATESRYAGHRRQPESHQMADLSPVIDYESDSELEVLAALPLALIPMAGSRTDVAEPKGRMGAARFDPDRDSARL